MDPQVVDERQKQSVAAIANERPHDSFDDLIGSNLVLQNGLANLHARAMARGPAAFAGQNRLISRPTHVGDEHVSASPDEQLRGKSHQLGLSRGDDNLSVRSGVCDGLEFCGQRIEALPVG